MTLAEVTARAPSPHMSAMRVRAISPVPSLRAQEGGRRLYLGLTLTTFPRTIVLRHAQLKASLQRTCLYFLTFRLFPDERMLVALNNQTLSSVYNL